MLKTETVTELARPEVLAVVDDNALAQACELAQEACMLFPRKPGPVTPHGEGLFAATEATQPV